MTEELEQLLSNLKLHRMHAVYDEQLRAADLQQITYTDFVAGLLRAQWRDRQRMRWNGASAGRCCPNGGRWKRFPMPGSRA